MNTSKIALYTTPDHPLNISAPDAIINMFEHDHSAARGKMSVRELIVFKHNSELGCAPAYKLFEAVRVERKDSTTSAPARSYADYVVTIDDSSLPEGVTCQRMI